MSKFDFESRLQDSIASVYYKVPYLARTIAKAQQLYDADKDSEAREQLDNAVAMLRAAGEDWAADKVEDYKRFM